MANVEVEDSRVAYDEVEDSRVAYDKPNLKYDDLLEESSSEEKVVVRRRSKVSGGAAVSEFTLRVVSWDLGSLLLHLGENNSSMTKAGKKAVAKSRLDKQVEWIVGTGAHIVFLQGVVYTMREKLETGLSQHYHVLSTELPANLKWFLLWMPCLSLLALTIFIENSFSSYLAIPIFFAGILAAPDVVVFLARVLDSRLDGIPSTIWNGDHDTGGLIVLASKRIFKSAEIADNEPYGNPRWFCMLRAWHPLRLLERILFTPSILLVKSVTHTGRRLALCTTKLIAEEDGDTLDQLVELHWRLCDLPRSCPLILGGNFNIHCSDEDETRWKFLRDVGFKPVFSGPVRPFTWDRSNPRTQTALTAYRSNGTPDRVYLRAAGGSPVRPSMMCPKCEAISLPPRCDDCGEVILPGYVESKIPPPEVKNATVVFKGQAKALKGWEASALSDHYGLQTDICFKSNCF